MYDEAFYPLDPLETVQRLIEHNATVRLSENGSCYESPDEIPCELRMSLWDNTPEIRQLLEPNSADIGQCGNCGESALLKESKPGDGFIYYECDECGEIYGIRANFLDRKINIRRP